MLTELALRARKFFSREREKKVEELKRFSEELGMSANGAVSNSVGQRPTNPEKKH